MKQLLIGGIIALIISNLSFTYTTPLLNNNKEEGKYYVLLMAVDEYESDNWQSLKSPINDMEELENILIEKYKFEATYKLYNKQFTKRNVDSILTLLQSKLKVSDKLLIAYAGNSLDVMNEGYWLPSDANEKSNPKKDFIANQSIVEACSNFKSNQILVLTNAFFSHKVFLPEPMVFENDGTAEYYDQIEKLISRQAYVSGKIQPILAKDARHSMFYKNIINFLKHNKEPNITISELDKVIRGKIELNSPNTAQLGVLRYTGHEGGQFLFQQKKLDKNCLLNVFIEEGVTVDFIDQGTLRAKASDKAVEFTWARDNIFLDNTTSILPVKESGMYIVIARNAAGCESAAITQVTIQQITEQIVERIVIKEKLNIKIEEGDNIVFDTEGRLNTVINRNEAVLYKWSKQGRTIGHSSSLKVDKSGVYTIEIKNKTGEIATDNITVAIKYSDRKYKIKKDESLPFIANQFYGDSTKWKVIYHANQGEIDDINTPIVGAEIMIPNLKRIQETEKSIEEVKPAVSSKTIVRLAANQNLPPFTKNDITKNGMLTEIVETTFARMNYKAAIQYQSWNETKLLAHSQEVMAAYPFFKHNNDENLFHFSAPLFKTLHVFYARKEEDFKFRNPKDLEGKRVGVYEGYNIAKLQEYTKKGLIQIIVFESLAACFHKLQKGEIDLIALPELIGDSFLAEATEYNKTDFKTLNRAIDYNTLHLIISKIYPNSERIINDFNKTLKQLEQNGTLAKIHQMHLNSILNNRP